MSDTVLPVTATALFLAGILLLLLLLVHLVRFIRMDERERRRLMHQRSYDAWRLGAIAAAVIVIGGARMIYWTGAELRSFSSVVHGREVGSMHVFTSADNLPRFIYSAYDTEGREVVEVVPVREAGVQLEGELVRWVSWLEPLGLGTFFKATRVDFLKADSTGGTHHAVASNPIQRGSTELFAKLEGMSSWFPLCSTGRLSSGVIASDNDFSYKVSIENDSLVLVTLR